MKSIKNITLSALLTLVAFGAVLYTSCNKDECKDVVCQNGGTCAGGNCTCQAGWEGTRCETATASKITGTYSANETCQPPVSGGSTWSSVLSQSSSDMTKIVITNFGASNANVTGKVVQNAITLDQTTIGSKTVTGTGVISGNTVTINYVLSGTTTYNCTMIMTKQ